MSSSTSPAAMPPAGAGSKEHWQVRVLTGLGAFRKLLRDWTALSESAAEPNVFYEPWILLPALKLLHQRTDVELWTVHRERYGVR